MKKFLVFVSGMLLAGLVGYWGYLTYFQNETWIVKDIAFVIKDSSNAQQSEADAQRKKGGINIGCYVWGPFKEKSAAYIASKIKRIGLFEKAIMKDRFLPEMYIAYLGPFDNKEAALAFQKQFRQQGYRKARAILQGGLSFGVEIEAFSSQQEAQKFLTGPRTPKVRGVRITNRLGEPSGEVDFSFQDISDEERMKLLELWRATPRSELKNCSF